MINFVGQNGKKELNLFMNAISLMISPAYGTGFMFGFFSLEMTLYWFLKSEVSKGITEVQLLGIKAGSTCSWAGLGFGATFCH